MTPKDKLQPLVNPLYKDDYLKLVDENGMYTLTNKIIKAKKHLIKRIIPLEVDDDYDYPFFCSELLYCSYDPETQGGGIGTYLAINPFPKKDGSIHWTLSMEDDNRWGGNPTWYSEQFEFDEAYIEACLLIDRYAKSI